MTDAYDAQSWWQQMIDRREANQRTALGAAALVGAGGLLQACDKKVEEVESGALQLQQSAGWNVGYDQEGLTLSSPVDLDSRGQDWTPYRDPQRLVEVLTPSDAGWASAHSPALFQALSQPTLAEQIRPVFDAAMGVAHGRGRALGELVAASQNPEQTLIVLDLPGPEAVAAAAGMARTAQPLFWLDNWPHPRGVVDSHQTLGAAIYYAGEFEDAVSWRAATPAHVLVLDRNRLTPYRDAESDFDNRYMAEIPGPAELRSLGVTKVLYVTPDHASTDADDLNEPLVELKNARVNVSLVSMAAFELGPGTAGKDDPPGTVPAQQYYYGGQRESHGHFYSHFPIFFFYRASGYNHLATRPASPRVAPPPRYTPSPRRTMFSGRTTGGVGGVGSKRPTGFGRITHRVGGDGRVSGLRSGSITRAGGVGGG